MEIIGIPGINAMGLVGAEEAPHRIFDELDYAGEIMKLDNSNIESMSRDIYSKGMESFGSEKTSFVGGDHSITYPLFSAFQKSYKDPFLIVFDAHADCMPPMKEPTHEEFLRGIIESGFSPEKVILIGARKIEGEEKRFLEESGVKVFSEIYDIESCADYVTEKANGHDVYVSVDIDVFDPSYAPGVSYAEPNGLTSKEFFYIINRIFLMRCVRCLDVVEVIPSKDEKYDYRTVKLAAKIFRDFWV